MFWARFVMALWILVIAVLLNGYCVYRDLTWNVKRELARAYEKPPLGATVFASALMVFFGFTMFYALWVGGFWDGACR